MTARVEVEGKPGLRDRVIAAPATWTFAAVNGLVFAWVALHGDTTDPGTLLRFGALEQGAIWRGEWWRLLTAGFLHVGLLHLAANVFFGVPWCLALERELGARRFAALYLLSAVGASGLSLLGGDRVSAGASGALFGVIGGTLALHRRMVGSWRTFFDHRGVRVTLANLILFAVISGFLPFDQLAHAGGFATGALVAWTLSRPAPRRWFGWVPVAAGLAALLAVALTPPRAWRLRDTAEREIQAALAKKDARRARSALERAWAAGVRTRHLDYLEGAVLLREDRPEDALVVFRTLEQGPDDEVTPLARRARADIALSLATSHWTGRGRPADRAAARRYFKESCAAGGEKACSVLDELCHGGDADACREPEPQPSGDKG